MSEAHKHTPDELRQRFFKEMRGYELDIHKALLEIKSIIERKEEARHLALIFGLAIVDGDGEELTLGDRTGIVLSPTIDYVAIGPGEAIEELLRGIAGLAIRGTTRAYDQQEPM